MSSSSQVVDCVVIGAGVSGLSAASALARKGYRVTVVEARNRIGGRTYTSFDEGLPCPVDFGASFVHGVDGNPLAKYCKQHDIRLYSGQMDGLLFMPNGQRMEEDQSERLTANVFTSLFYHSREASRQVLPPHARSLADYMLGPDSPLFDGLESEDEKALASQTVTSMDGWTGAALDRVSFRYWGFEREFEGVDKIVMDGYTKVLAPMADELLQHGGQIHLNDAVTSVEYDNDLQLVSVETTSGNSFSAKSCVCTIPLGVLKSGGPTFRPPLPKRRLAAIKQAGFGLLNKVVIAYPHAWWPADATTLYLFQEQSLEDNSRIPPALAKRALFVQSYLPFQGKPVLVFFIGGQDGRDLETLNDEEVKNWLHGILTRAFLSLPDAPPSAPEPSYYHVTRWDSDPWSRGSYAYIPVSKDGDTEPPSPLQLIELSRPLWGGRLGFAGEHTECDHYASVHGALISGWRESERIVAQLEGSWADVRSTE